MYLSEVTQCCSLLSADSNSICMIIFNKTLKLTQPTECYNEPKVETLLSSNTISEKKKTVNKVFFLSKGDQAPLRCRTKNDNSTTNLSCHGFSCATNLYNGNFFFFCYCIGFGFMPNPFFTNSVYVSFSPKLLTHFTFVTNCLI